MTKQLKLGIYLNRYKWVLLITVGIKLLLFTISYVHVSGQYDFFEMWNRWDSERYISISEHGYNYAPEGEAVGINIVWYPLYPALIHTLTQGSIPPKTASVLISFVLSIIAAILLYEVARLDLDEKGATRAVWYLSIFPTAFFMQAGYTESLYLAISLACVYAYRKRQTVSAGLLGLLAALTRVTGSLLALLLMFEPKPKGKKRLLAPLLIGLGPLLYLGLNYSLFGNPFYFVGIYKQYQSQHLDFPWSGIMHLIRTVPHATESYVFMELAAIAFILIAIPLTYVYIRKSYAIYMAGNLLLMTATSFVLSTPRYALALFPLFILLGKVKNHIFLYTASGYFIVGLIYFALQFNMYKWAF